MLEKLFASLFAAALFFAAAVMVTAQHSAPNEATKNLHALFDEEWEYTMRENPTWASALGDRRYNDRWEDVSLAAIERRHLHAIATLARLKAINRGHLSPADALSYDLFKKNFETDIEGHKFRWHLIALDQRGGIQTADEIVDNLRFNTVKDYEDWIARLRALPIFVEQTITLLREGARTKITLPKIIMNRIPAQVDKQLVAKAEESPFYKPFKNFPASIPSAERERLSESARAAIGAHVIPSYQKFKQFFVSEYLPATFTEVGAWQMPQGAEMYAYFVRRYTTTTMTPQEVHETGLAEVKRIRAEMETIKSKVGFNGTLKEFFGQLRTDPKFYYKSPEELLNAYRAMSKRIDPQLVKVFRKLPRVPYGVEPIPDKIAPDTTTAYYERPAADGSRPGTYRVNLYKPETRPKYEMMALSLHEAVPGHHLQIALAQELGEVPNFRRYGGHTAFVEGWALYAESLGEEMGLYDDPYAKFGQLTYEMWRAVRLVVDTGMHSMKWTRQRAIDFFLDNAAKTELDIINEIDRYIAWPGQAVAYKTGELKIKALRARAALALGDKFDVREFHEVVLSSGAVPLDVLEANVNAWLAARKAQTTTGPTH